jgi:hypothetical protein
MNAIKLTILGIALGLFAGRQPATGGHCAWHQDSKGKSPGREAYADRQTGASGALVV